MNFFVCKRCNIKLEYSLVGLPDRLHGRSLELSFPISSHTQNRLQSHIHSVSQQIVRFIEEMVENKNIELKIYKNDWHF